MRWSAAAETKRTGEQGCDDNDGRREQITGIRTAVSTPAPPKSAHPSGAVQYDMHLHLGRAGVRARRIFCGYARLTRGSGLGFVVIEIAKNCAAKKRRQSRQRVRE